MKAAHDRSRIVVLSCEESRQVSREVTVAKSRNICLCPVEIEIMTRFGFYSLTRDLVRTRLQATYPGTQNIFPLLILFFTQ
jgi:hypothetical protein